MCEQSFYMEYILGYNGPSNKAADKGTICHKVLEITALCKKAVQEGKETIEDDVVGNVLTHKDSTSYLDGIIDQVYDYYTSNLSHNDWKPLDRKHCHDWVWKVLKLYDGKFNPRNRDVVDAEPHFDFVIEDDWAKYNYEGIEGQLAIKGTIDLITRLSPDCYEIIDWKTGKRKDWATGDTKDYEKLGTDHQLRLYHLAVKQLYPDIPNIITTIGFINDGGFFSLHFTDEDLPQTKETIKNRFEVIKNCKQPRLTKSWKCTKLCYQGKTNFEKTNITPIVELREGERTSIGHIMTKCEQTKYMVEKKGIDWVTKNYTKPGYSCSNYKSPGEIE
jgi:hypothetical protein